MQSGRLAQCDEYFADYPVEQGCTQSGGESSDEPCPRDGLTEYCLNKFPEDQSFTLGALYHSENTVHQIASGGRQWCDLP